MVHQTFGESIEHPPIITMTTRNSIKVHTESDTATVEIDQIRP
jgi:hypothetical protein